jgi:hypothetical protein
MKRQPKPLAFRVAEATAAYRRRSGVPAQADPSLHERAGGNLDARRIAARLGVPLKRLAPAVGYTPQGLAKNPTSERLQRALGEIAYVLGRLRALLDDNRSAAIWLRAPHPDLGGATPLSYILDGNASTIVDLLHAAESGQTA